MYKFLVKRASESVANSFWKLKSPQHGRIVVAGSIEGFCTFTTSNGYERSSSTESLQQKIVNALRFGERRKASGLLSELGRRSEALKDADFLLILKDCARLPDPLFALETWKLMEEKKIGIRGKCFFYAFRALCKGGYVKEAFSLMSLVQDNPDVYPLLPVYNNFLSSCVQTSSLAFANDCLNLMEHQMVGKNEITYTELLKGLLRNEEGTSKNHLNKRQQTKSGLGNASSLLVLHALVYMLSLMQNLLAVLQQNLSAVHEIWKECTKYYSLSMLSLRKFVWSFARLKDLESAYTTLHYMVDLACQGNLMITKTAEGKLFNSRLDVPIPSNGDSIMKRCSKDNRIMPNPFKYQEAAEMQTSNSDCNLSADMESHGRYMVGASLPTKVVDMHVKKILRWSFNDVLHACANLGNYILAEQLMSQMHNLGLEPSYCTYDGFLRANLTEKGFHQGMEVLKVMEQKNMKLCDSTLASISIICSRGLELDLAEGFLHQMSTSPSPFPYNAFLEACDAMDQPERAIRVLAKMKYLKILPDIRTYELLFSLFGNVNAPYEEGNMLSQVDAAKRISTIEMDMTNNGIQHSRGSFKNLLKALGMEGMINELLRYLSLAENPLSSAYSFLAAPIYNIVLHSLVDARETHMAAETFKGMKSCGIPSDAGTYNIMIHCCSITNCFKSASSFVSLMIRDGFYPGTVTYTTLIKILLELDNFDDSLKLLNQGKLDGIEPDLLLYNTILQTAYEKGRIDVVELIVEQMHQDKIQPDTSTCSYVFSAYVDGGFYSTAMEALQVLSMRMISEDDDILEKTKIECQNLIVAEDMETESHIMKLFRDSEHLALALLNLRWCAVAGFSISWLPNESGWAKRLSSNYATSQRVPG